MTINEAEIRQTGRIQREKKALENRRSRKSFSGQSDIKSDPSSALSSPGINYNPGSVSK